MRASRQVLPTIRSRTSPLSSLPQLMPSQFPRPWRFGRHPDLPSPRWLRLWQLDPESESDDEHSEHSLFGSNSSWDEISDADSAWSDDSSIADEIINECSECTSDDISEETCTICLDGFEGDQRACAFPVCNHTFHRECLLPWLKRRPKCPNCRRHIFKDLEVWEHMP